MTVKHSVPCAYAATEQDEGQRLDRFLAGLMPGLSRSRIKALIKGGHVAHLGRTIIEPNYRVKFGDAFAVRVPEPEPAAPRPEAIPLAILHEDDAVIVIDKPAGLVVHPAAGNWTGTLVNALIAHCGDSLSGIGGVKRPGIVHRLDKDTSGVMVVAKTDAAHHGLARQFADHGRQGTLERRYLALVWGRPTPPQGVIRASIARHAAQRQKMAVAADHGKPAATHYRVLEVLPNAAGHGKRPRASVVECWLETGRTHQIRVHMAHIGHPVISDPVYAAHFQSKIRALPETAQSAIMRLNRQALHAATLGFTHPITKHFMHFHSAMPTDMECVLRSMR